LQCFVDGISHSGEGVARINGKATFIPFTIPGETVDVNIIEEKKSFQRGRLKDLVTSSSDRIDAPCPYYYKCGGCSYQHVNYNRQLELKRQVVKDSLKRIGGIDIEVNPVLGMEIPWRYRNKVEWHTGTTNGQAIMGYYVNDSRVLIGIDSCLLISTEMEDISRYIKEHLKDLNIPEGCEITVRQSAADQEMMVIFNGKGSSGIDFARMLNHQEVASIHSIDQGKLRLHYGEPALFERIFGTDLDISPLAFFQVNHYQTERLIEIVKEFALLRETDTILDAYCGTGSIALSLAGLVQKVVGVESGKPAIKDAKRNAFKNNITNCKFIKGACEEIIPELEEQFDVVILDPPRAGCKPEVINAITRMASKRVVYVSCNPATLARDLGLFIKGGYYVKEVQPIDMFPQSHHVETVVRIYRG